MIELRGKKPGLLEKFGIYYLSRFSIHHTTHKPFDLSDIQLQQKVKIISNKGVFLSILTGVLAVIPIVLVDLKYANSDLLTHYGILTAAIVVSTVIEFYFLFLISLKAVHDVSGLINLHANKRDYLDGLFGVKNILARTALELPDPELSILGIDPFKQLSKKNIFILGLMYKGKIILTNVLLKILLLSTVGATILGIPIAWEAVLVEAFWNAVVIKRVVDEARLRLFGFALAEEITQNVIHDGLIFQLSSPSRTGCLRAIGNAVVMTRNYHPNMVILIIHIAELLRIKEENRYDDWQEFLITLENISSKERYFLLDLFTVAAAFDGKLSAKERKSLHAVYKEDHALYLPRLKNLTSCLKKGKLNEALALCKLDFQAG